MFKIINLGNQESSLKVLTDIKNKQYVPFDVRITNSHITSLNSVIGKRVFRKDTLYIGYDTLWELMQPIGKKNEYQYRLLRPKLDTLPLLLGSEELN